MSVVHLCRRALITVVLDFTFSSSIEPLDPSALSLLFHRLGSSPDSSFAGPAWQFRASRLPFTALASFFRAPPCAALSPSTLRRRRTSVARVARLVLRSTTTSPL
jgi:hypothetical protein